MTKIKIVSVSITEEMHEKALKLSAELLGKRNLSAYISYLLKKSIDESQSKNGG